MSKKTNILFNQNSVNLDSPAFAVDKQITVMAVGMAPGDYITFELILLKSGDRSTVCGCRISDATGAVISGVQELLCPTCVSDEDQQPVRLTDRNPVVVLDHPQNALLRAIYHGTGITDRTVTVWWSESETNDLTDAMRGCLPRCCEDNEQTWDVTGLHRCTPEVVQVQERSNCGELRWVDCGAIVWTDTGQLRCLAGSVTATEIEQTNQCGQRRWITGPAQAWTATGLRDCSGEFVAIQQQNQCGLLRWVNTDEPVVWTETGITRCVAGTLRVQEATQCGSLRWTDTEEVCGGGEGFDGVTIEPGSCLTGNGTPSNPLGLDQDCLDPFALTLLDTATVNLEGAGTPGLPLQADVNVSAAPGNLLGVRADGLYYGIEAPPEIAVLYVSPSLGSNSNPGTRAEPLATIAEALNRQVNAPVNYAIFLRSGEVFRFPIRWNRNLANFTIRYYDDPLYDDAAASACPGYFPMYADNLSRPQLIVDAYISGTLPAVTGLIANNITLQGINVHGRWELPDTTQPNVALSGGFGGNAISCFGCILTSTPQPLRRRWMFDPAALDLATTIVNFDPDGQTFLVNTTPGTVFARIANHVNPAGCGGSTPAITDQVPSTPAAQAMVTVNNLAAGATYNAPTKSTWGVRTGWDLFASVPGGCCPPEIPDPEGNVAPVANFTMDGEGLEVEFTDASTDGDGTIVSRHWNFGDGNTSTATNPTHTYGGNGSYFVTLTVTDDDGATHNRMISITVNTGGGPNPGGGGDPGYPPGVIVH